MGWSNQFLPEVRIEDNADSKVSKLISSQDKESVNICAGFRSNGFVSHAQDRLASLEIPYWIILETIEDRGLRGWLKRAIYRRSIAERRAHLNGILAIGYRTRDWLISRGANPCTTFPFAYFPNLRYLEKNEPLPSKGPYQVIFVGRQIATKQFNLLQTALSYVNAEIELTAVGTGPGLGKAMRLSKQFSYRTTFIDNLEMNSVPTAISNADCLVLPSRHDGWGAVVSESLAVGTPVICSDACGSAGVVRRTGEGGVFRSGSVSELTGLIEDQLSKGKVSRSRRESLANWSLRIGGESGAKYLLDILAYVERNKKSRPIAPWDIGEK